MNKKTFLNIAVAIVAFVAALVLPPLANRYLPPSHDDAFEPIAHFLLNVVIPVLFVILVAACVYIAARRKWKGRAGTDTRSDS